MVYVPGRNVGEQIDPATIGYAIGRNVGALVGQSHLRSRDYRA